MEEALTQIFSDSFNTKQNEYEGDPLMPDTVEVSWLHNFENNTTDIRMNRDKEDEKILYSGALMMTCLNDTRKPKWVKEVQEMTFEEAKNKFKPL